MSAAEHLGEQFAYRGLHSAPGSDEPALHELDKSVGEDIYTHTHYFHTGEPQFDSRSSSVIRAARGNPNQRVSTYRAVPPGVTRINPGDWVTPSLEYAKQHAKHPSDPGQDMYVIGATVPAHTLRWNGDSIHEYGYHGPARTGSVRRPPKKGWPDQ